MNNSLFFRVGRYAFILTLLGAMLISSLALTPAASAQEPGITSPAPGSSVSGSVSLIGTANIDPFLRYELYFKQEPNGDDAYIYFGGGTSPVFNGQVGVWQTADLAPGAYTLRMRVVKQDGNYSEHFVPNLSVNQEPPTPTPTTTPDAPTEPTSTPIPVNTPTPIPQPTPAVVQVEQPNLGDDPTPTATAELIALGDSGATDATDAEGAANSGVPAVVAEAVTAAEGESAGGFTEELGAALAIDRLRDQFFTGVRWSGGIFLVVGLIFGGKRLLEWILARNG